MRWLPLLTCRGILDSLFLAGLCVTFSELCAFTSRVSSSSPFASRAFSTRLSGKETFRGDRAAPIFPLRSPSALLGGFSTGRLAIAALRSVAGALSFSLSLAASSASSSCGSSSYIEQAELVSATSSAACWFVEPAVSPSSIPFFSSSACTESPSDIRLCQPSIIATACLHLPSIFSQPSLSRIISSSRI